MLSFMYVSVIDIDDDDDDGDDGVSRSDYYS